MRSHWLTLAVAAALVGGASAQEVEQVSGFRRPRPPQADCPCPAPLMPGVTPGAPGMPGVPGMPPGQGDPPQPPPADPGAAPTTDAFAQAGEGGTAAATSMAPAFFGDLIGLGSARVLRGAQGINQLVRTPAPSRSGAWKTVDNESPIPTDRIYYTFNYFSNVSREVNAENGAPPFTVFRHLIGLEKTLFKQRASVGVRLPFVEALGPPELSNRQFADMSIIAKVALVRDSRRVVSLGFVTTVPTGQGFIIERPNIRGELDGAQQDVLFPVILQPFVGYWRTLGQSQRAYFHAFNSIAVPTDSRDVVILTGDVGFGYWLYRNPCDRFVQGVVPTIELHQNTPLTQRGARRIPLGFADQLNLTAGTFIALPRSTLGVAAGIPLLGPRPYDVELVANFTLRF